MKPTQLIACLATLLIAFFGLITPLSADDSLVTDWLKATPESKEARLQSEVIEVTHEDDDIIAVDVAIPVDDLEEYETVVVIGKMPEKKKKPEFNAITLVKPLKWLHDDENEPYGLRFYVKGVEGFEFRIQLSQSDEN